MHTELMELGLTDGESKAYMALLELGSSTVGPITKKTGISYSKIYEVLQRLCQKGLATFIVKQNTKYFQPANPTRLQDYLERQKSEVETREKKLKKILPHLTHSMQSSSLQEAEVFVGFKGVHAAYMHLFEDIESDTETMFLYTHKDDYGAYSEKFYLGFLDFFTTLPIKSWGVASRNYKDSHVIRTLAKHMDIRFTDDPLPANVDIYADKILLLAWSKNPVAILIRSAELVKLYREYIDELWRRSK